MKKVRVVIFRDDLIRALEEIGRFNGGSCVVEGYLPEETQLRVWRYDVSGSSSHCLGSLRALSHGADPGPGWSRVPHLDEPQGK